MKSYWKQMLLVLIFALGEALGQTSLPLFFNSIVTQGVATGDFIYIRNMGLLMLGITVLLGVCTVLSGYFSAHVTASFTSRMRADMFLKVQSFSQLDFQQFDKETLLTRATVDTNQMQIVVINMLRSALSVPFLAVFALVQCFYLDARLSIIMVIAFALCTLFVRFNMKKSLPIFAKLQKKIDEISLLMDEKLLGARSIRAFGRQEYETEKLTKVHGETKALALLSSRYIIRLTPIVQIVMNLSIVIILWQGSLQVQSRLVDVADLLTYIQYCLMIINGFSVIMMILNTLPKAQVAAKRIDEVLCHTPQNACPQNPQKIQDGKGEIVLKDVSFSYDGAQEAVLHKINLCIPAGKTTAIIGPTGSGKSTLLKLLLRFFNSEYVGDIIMDGVDMRQMTTHDVRTALSYAPQNPSLFAGSLFENLCVAKQNLSEKEALEVCETAQIGELLENKEGGLHFNINQGGANLSGGQRQRVSLARAFTKEASVYLLDDSFSALDFKTAAKVRRAMTERLKDKTLIIVADRLAPILNADQIVVMEAGRVVQVGKHEALLKTCPLYLEIYNTQSYHEEASL